AFIFPVIVFVLIALLVGSMGILRYQEVVLLSQEGARYASVHGANYRSEVAGGRAPYTADEIYNAAIKPRLMCVDSDKVSYSVTWDQNDQPYSVRSGDYEKPMNNTVTVTVTYQWFPEMYLVGPINLSGTTTVPMAY